MRRTLRTSILAALCASTVGCGPAATPQEHASRTAQAIDVDNGRELNGRELNGRELNGRELNGRELNGRELNGVSLQGATRGGVSLGDLSLQGSELVGVDASGQTVRGAALVGTVLSAATPAGGKAKVRIVGVSPSAAQPDVMLYTAEDDLAGDGSWEPLCGTDASGNLDPAIALAGTWNSGRGPSGGAHLDAPGTITFACAGFALAKCVGLGYRPWATAQRCVNGGCGTYSLAAYHQACTRMLRADYCGDGRSFTVDGTLINVYDALGIQADTESWAFEAEWTPDGARCLSRMRIPDSSAVPDCVRQLMSAGCGDLADFDRGALLMDEDAH